MILRAVLVRRVSQRERYTFLERSVSRLTNRSLPRMVGLGTCRMGPLRVPWENASISSAFSGQLRMVICVPQAARGRTSDTSSRSPSTISKGNGVELTLNPVACRFLRCYPTTSGRSGPIIRQPSGLLGESQWFFVRFSYDVQPTTSGRSGTSYRISSNGCLYSPCSRRFWSK